MGGIKDLLGFHFWLDNSKRGPIESMLANEKKIPKDRQSILRDLKGDQAFLKNANIKGAVRKGMKS